MRSLKSPLIPPWQGSATWSVPGRNWPAGRSSKATSRLVEGGKAARKAKAKAKEEEAEKKRRQRAKWAVKWPAEVAAKKEEEEARKRREARVAETVEQTEARPAAGRGKGAAYSKDLFTRRCATLEKGLLPKLMFVKGQQFSAVRRHGNDLSPEVRSQIPPENVMPCCLVDASCLHSAERIMGSSSTESQSLQPARSFVAIETATTQI